MSSYKDIGTGVMVIILEALKVAGIHPHKHANTLI